jgi:hypothetical protein
LRMAPMTVAEQSASQKELAGAFCSEVTAFVSSEPGMQGEGTQRNEAFGERGGAPARPAITVPAAVRPLGFEEPLDQWFGTFIGNAKRKRRLRRATMPEAGRSMAARLGSVLRIAQSDALVSELGSRGGAQNRLRPCSIPALRKEDFNVPCCGVFHPYSLAQVIQLIVLFRRSRATSSGPPTGRERWPVFIAGNGSRRSFSRFGSAGSRRHDLDDERVVRGTIGVSAGPSVPFRFCGVPVPARVWCQLEAISMRRAKTVFPLAAAGTAIGGCGVCYWPGDRVCSAGRATREEAAEALPGDDKNLEPTMQSTRAITINAPPLSWLLHPRLGRTPDFPGAVRRGASFSDSNPSHTAGPGGWRSDLYGRRRICPCEGGEAVRVTRRARDLRVAAPAWEPDPADRSVPGHGFPAARHACAVAPDANDQLPRQAPTWRRCAGPRVRHLRQRPATPLHGDRRAEGHHGASRAGATGCPRGAEQSLDRTSL